MPPPLPPDAVLLPPNEPPTPPLPPLAGDDDEGALDAAGSVLGGSRDRGEPDAPTEVGREPVVIVRLGRPGSSAIEA